MSEKRPDAKIEKRRVRETTERHWAAWLLDVVVGIGALAQVGIGIILICQLRAYEQSNELTRESLSLSEEAIKTAHTPWIYFHAVKLGFDGDKTTVHFKIKNPGDSPARKIVIQLGFPDPSHENFRNGPNQEVTETEIAPDLDSSYTMLVWGDPGTDQKALYNVILNGTRSLTFTMTYQDIFNRNITHREIMKFYGDPDKCELLLNDSSISP